MYRFILCLPLCLVQNGGRPESPPSENGITTGFVSNDPLPVKDPLAFLEKCLERYEEQGIKGYRCTFQKQERIDGKLMPSEETEVYYREKPYSVYMHWLRGQRRADSVIYVEGENDDKMLVHPAGVAGALVKVVTRDVDGPDAKQAGRYTLKQLGMKQGMERSLKDWKAARAYLLENYQLANALVEADPKSYKAGRHLAISLEKLGELALRKGDLRGARNRVRRRIHRHGQPPRARANGRRLAA